MSLQAAPKRAIEYLSRPAEVSMAEHWFDIASAEHFWIERRFDVLNALAGDLIAESQYLAELGCGNGLLQRQVEVRYEKAVSGFDLNEYGLTRNLSRNSPLYCYDVFQKNAELRGKFDVIFLFDVLEHILDEDSFLGAVFFHLAPKGVVIFNLPAGAWAFSVYDQVVGHARRYSIDSLAETALRNKLLVRRWTYWGLPLIPTLVLRKLRLAGVRDPNSVVRTGFDPGSKWLNRSLAFLSKCEVIPQKIAGTSLMVVLARES